MPVHLFDADERVTVADSDLVPDGDPETTYTIRLMGIEDHRAIVKARTVDVVNRHTHQKEPKTDWAAVADDVIDFVLVEWAGLLWRGQPVPCIREQKLRLDAVRRGALNDRAGMNQIARAPEVRVESFPES